MRSPGAKTLNELNDANSQLACSRATRIRKACRCEAVVRALLILLSPERRQF